MNRRARGEPRPSGRPGRWIVVVAVVAALAGAAWWWLAGRPGEPAARAERQEYAPYTGPLEFPEAVDRAPAEIRELYAFAARRPDVMHYVPCYCGCGGVGHKSAYDCYIDEVRPDGAVDIDDMAFT